MAERIHEKQVLAPFSSLQAKRARLILVTVWGLGDSGPLSGRSAWKFSGQDSGRVAQ